LSFRLLGVNSYHCVYPPTLGSTNVLKYLFEDTAKTLGAVMVVETEPLVLAQRIVADLKKCRSF